MVVRISHRGCNETAQMPADPGLLRTRRLERGDDRKFRGGFVYGLIRVVFELSGSDSAYTQVLIRPVGKDFVRFEQYELQQHPGNMGFVSTVS